MLYRPAKKRAKVESESENDDEDSGDDEWSDEDDDEEEETLDEWIVERMKDFHSLKVKRMGANDRVKISVLKNYWAYVITLLSYLHNWYISIIVCRRKRYSPPRRKSCPSLLLKIS